MMNVENMKKIMEDENSLKEFLACKTIEEGLAYLNDRGVNATVEEMKSVLDDLKTIVEAAKAENMNLDDMDSVAGGQEFIEKALKVANTGFQMYTNYQLGRTQLMMNVAMAGIDMAEGIYEAFASLKN